MANYTPLSAFLDTDSTQNLVIEPRKKYKKKSLFLGLFVLIPTLSSTFAGQITLGSGAIEFGQGAQSTDVCDSNITVSLQSSYDSASGVFEVSTITLGDLDTQASGCAGKVITISALNSSGTALDLDPTSSRTAYLYTVSGTSGATQTRTLNLDASANVDATQVSRVLIETSS